MSGEGEDFVCAMCGCTFQKAWSDEEAKAEVAETFPDELDEPMAIVCDDCYQRLVDLEIERVEGI